jgi:hypothetical protein
MGATKHTTLTNDIIKALLNCLIQPLKLKWQLSANSWMIKRSLKSTIFWDIMPCSPLALLVTCFHTGILLGLFVNLEDGGDLFLWYISWLSTDYMTLHPRRQYSSQPPLWETQILHKVCLITRMGKI